jgi:hypothetical protein
MRILNAVQGTGRSAAIRLTIAGVVVTTASVLNALSAHEILAPALAGEWHR